METVQVVVSTSLKDEISTACVWDAYNGTLLARYRGGGFCNPHGICYSGGYLLSCEKGKPMLHLWQVNKQHCESKRLIAPGKINTVAFSGDWMHIAVAVDEKIYLYQTSSGRLLGIGSRHFQPITVIKFCDDSTLLCCGGEDGLVTIWNLASFCFIDKSAEPFLSFSEHTLPVTDLMFFSGNLRSRVLSVSIDRTCKIYDLATKKIVLSIVFEVQLTCVTLSPVELELFVGNLEGEIHEFSLRSPPRTLEAHAVKDENNPIFSGHVKAVQCLTSTIDSCHLISGSLDETIKIWHISSRQCLRTITQKGPVTNILSLILPKSVFAHDFEPRAFIHDFLNPANIEEDEEQSFEIITPDDVLPPVPQELQSFISSTSNTDSYKEEINRIKNINNTMYKFAINAILKMPNGNKTDKKKPGNVSLTKNKSPATAKRKK